MHVLVTGHTGFKGAWLCQLLVARGHDVSGLALDPVDDALYDRAGLADLVRSDLRRDVRDADAVRDALDVIRPDAVIHMAAQPLVRDSYRRPRWTMETNVIGTLNVLEAVDATPSVRALVVVTTDKVYRNVDQEAGYVESDALGGHDPYSASKAMADLLTQSWRASFAGCPTGIARAGNVIGGGDVSTDRLFPDLVRGFADGRPVLIRYPQSVRPWQHVLDCLDGYTRLLDTLLDPDSTAAAIGEWNFGPGPEAFVTVGEVADIAAARWGVGARWVIDDDDHPHEANLLALDASKARDHLAWDDRLTFTDAVAWTIDWERAVTDGADPGQTCRDQIAAYEALGR